MKKEEARQEVAKLVAKYQSLDERAIRKYSEADTRRAFIEPLFSALGWNMLNREEVAEEVKAAMGRVDYVFKLHGVSQFYLEAKPLRADLTRPEYAKQSVTYAYNKGITWAVLTDFERLQVYNAQTGRCVRNLSYDDYLTDFEDLWLLSKESFQVNALNERAEKEGVLPPRLGIEQRLYNQLRRWRGDLFNQLHIHNENLGDSQIDEVIQRLFNRLIFIRNCEDRRIEEKVLLGAVNEWRGSGRKGDLIKRLQHIFRDFDGYYDSDLFAYHLTDDVFVDSATIEHVISGLYEVPGGMASYDFSIIDADVLGVVYEQYLGHIAGIVKQRAKEAQARMDLGLPTEETYEITAKKQRRKEHGIYYTPKFVTNYIVKETVGRFLEERSHNEILNMKILDPACGSGSFLIRAYDELLNYHAYQRGKPVSELDQWERLPILTNNIFGVDLDIQAVEIACLNLLLRSLAKRETLPSLADNIRQGNSLISGTDEELKKYFGDNWREKKPFNWEEEFKDIMANGGFDVVIGNPPYVDVRRMDDRDKQFFLKRYPTAYNRLDIFAVFLAKGVHLLRDGGLLGFIIPNTVLTSTSFAPLRRFFLNNCKICQIFDMGPGVFELSTVETMIIILQKEPNEELRRENRIEVLTSIGGHLPDEVQRRTVVQSVFTLTNDNAFNISMTDLRRNFWHKIESESVPLWHMTDGCWNGINTGNTKKDLIANTPIDHRYRKVIDGRNIERYTIIPSGQFILYDRAILERSREERIFTAPEKIILRKIGKTLVAAYDSEQYYSLINTTIILPKQPSPINLKFLLALLNSQLLGQYYKDNFLGVQIKGAFLKQLPICRIDLDNLKEKKMHNDLVTLVDRMLELNKRLAPIRSTYCNERDELIREIERTDKEIDNLVYDLYGLTEKEREIVEEVSHATG